MRKQERTLRALIREMSWGAPDDDDPRSGDLGVVAAIDNPDDDQTRGRKFAKNLSRSSGWAKTAKQLYENVPYPIWTIAYIGSLERDFEMYGRAQMMDLGVGLKKLQEWKKQHPENFAELNLNKLSSVGPGDLVIFYATETQSDLEFNATPWKVFHAIFDSPVGQRLETWTNWAVGFEEAYGHFTGRENVMANVFTMGMARTGRKKPTWFMDTAGELLYDIPAQEVINRRRFNLNEKELVKLDEEDQEVLLNLIPFAQAVGEEFREKARGKFIMVDVDTEQ